MRIEPGLWYLMVIAVMIATLVVVAMVIEIDEKDQRTCQIACDPDLVVKCDRQWAVCAPAMLRSVKIGGSHAEEVSEGGREPPVY